VSGRLDAAGAAKAADALIAALRDPKTSSDALYLLAEALGAVSGRLDAATAAAHAAKAADVLVARMRDPKTPPNVLYLLALALRRVSGRLDAAGAAKAADVLVAALGDPRTPTNALSDLAQALKTVGARLGPHGIVRVLQHPLASGPAQRALLEVLEQPTRRTFSSPWHFIDWADSNGVDFLAQASARPGRD
jgi:hypothetical protein